MSALQQLLAAYDESLSHKWESLAGALHGLDDAEASWQLPAYAAQVESDLLPPPGTVLWYIVHLDHCMRHYRIELHARPLDTEPETLPPPLGSLRSHLVSLDEAQRELRGVMEGLSDDDLGDACYGGMNVGEFIRSVTRHTSWHAGQITTLRRAYRAAVAPQE